jgi:hypothetical protein
VLARLEAETGVGAADWTLESGKFHHGVAPGSRVQITQDAQDDARRRFEVREGGRLVASGVLVRRAR